MAKTDLAKLRLGDNEEEDLPKTAQLAEIHPFLRSPATAVQPKDYEDYEGIINGYFSGTVDAGIEPSLTGLALAMGLPGVSSINRLARRNPPLRWMISRAITTIAFWYESHLLTETSGAKFALENLHDFDDLDPPGAPPIQAWKEKQIVQVESRITGIQSPDEIGSELSPEEAYYRIVRGEGELVLQRLGRTIEVQGERIDAQADD